MSCLKNNIKLEKRKEENVLKLSDMLFSELKKHKIKILESIDREEYQKILKKLKKNKNNKDIKVFFGIFEDKPKCCRSCGNADNTKIVKNGRVTQNVLIANVLHKKTYLHLKKQRYLCKECGKIILPENTFVEKGCFISNVVKARVLQCLQKLISTKDISEFNNISHSTVNNIIRTLENNYKTNFNYLPEVLCVDEFYFKKGQMAFICIDGKEGEIINILESRKNYQIKQFFEAYSLDVRKKVKYFVCDMCKPYIKLAKKLFPNAKIITDRFHIINHALRTFNITRVQIMNKKNKNSTEYKMLKKFWKIFLKYNFELERSKTQYVRNTKKYMTSVEILEKMLSSDDELATSYECLQDLILAFSLKDGDKFYLEVNKWHEYFKNIKCKNDHNIRFLTMLSTFKELEEYIRNALKYEFSNGILEGTNNKIKKLKHIGYGYRSFFNFKIRVIIIMNPLRLKAS